MDDRWWERANCRGLWDGFMFPGRGADTRHARAVCAECPVIEPCFAESMASSDHDDIGIRAGLSERERKRLRKQARRGEAVTPPMVARVDPPRSLQPRHGTRWCYMKGCERPECREADRAYHAARYEARKVTA